MSEWLKEHAWKANSGAPTKPHRPTSTHREISQLRLADVPRCNNAIVRVRRDLSTCLTQFLHNSDFICSEEGRASGFDERRVGLAVSMFGLQQNGLEILTFP